MAASRNTPLHVLAVLALIVGVWISGKLCYQVAKSDCYWLDELHTAWTVQQSDNESFAAAAANGNQSTFYFGILRRVVAATGADVQSPMTLRGFSIVCSVLTVASVGYFVWYWTGSLFGSSLSVWAVGSDPRFIYYGSEARPYAFLMLLAIWQFFVFCLLTIEGPLKAESETATSRGRSLDRNSNRWAAVLLVLSVLLVLTHQTGILLLAAEAAILLALRKRSRTHGLFLGTVLVVACVAVVALQASTYSEVFQRRSQWNTLSSVSGLVDEFRIQLVLLFIVPLMILFVLWERGRFREQSRALIGLFTIGAAGVLPLVLACVSQYFGWAPLGLARYVLTGAILLPLFAGVVVSFVRIQWLQMVLATAIVYAGIFCPVPTPSGDGNSNVWQPANQFFIDAVDQLGNSDGAEAFRMRYENWPNAVAAINNLGDGRPVFLFANLLEDAQIAECEDANRAIPSEQLDYLKFPLTAFAISPDQVIPRPTLVGNKFNSLDIEKIVAANSCWVFARTDAATFEWIAKSLNEKLSQAKLRGAGFEIKTKFVNLKSKVGQAVPEWLTLYRVDLYRN